MEAIGPILLAIISSAGQFLPYLVKYIPEIIDFVIKGMIQLGAAMFRLLGYLLDLIKQLIAWLKAIIKKKWGKDADPDNTDPVDPTPTPTPDPVVPSSPILDPIVMPQPA